MTEDNKDNQTDWDKLNDNQKQFVLNRLNMLDRVDAYMDAYGMDDRLVARSAVSRLMLTNVDINAILDRASDESLVDAKTDMRILATEAVRQIAEVMRMGNTEYLPRLRAAMYIYKAIGAEEPIKKAVEVSGQIEHIITLQDVILESGLDSGKGDNDEQTERGNDG